MAHAGSMLQAPSSIPWQRFKAWIAEQEAYEHQHGHAAPLTTAQLNALSTLLPLHQEPSTSEEDFISLLHQHCQAHQMPLPKFTDLEPVRVLVAGGLQPRWRCVCTLLPSGESFPREGAETTAGQQAPVFASKKAAKQYAAKHALEHLSAQSSATSRRLVSLTSPAPVLGGSQNQPPASLPAHGFLRGNIDTLAISQTPQGIQGSPNIVREPNYENEGPSVFERVATLSGRLASDSPGYHIEEEPDHPGYFSGHPTFAFRGHIPPDVGKVSAVYGRKAAKHRIAEQVLIQLEAILAHREAIIAECGGGAGHEDAMAD